MLDAVMEDGRTVRVEVLSEAGQTLKVANPFKGERALLRRKMF